MAKIIPEELIARLIQAALPFTEPDRGIEILKSLGRDDGEPRRYGRVLLSEFGPYYTDHDLINFRQCIDELKAL